MNQKSQFCLYFETEGVHIICHKNVYTQC